MEDCLNQLLDKSRTDLYLHKQKTIRVKLIRIYDNFGTLYLEDVLL